MQNTNKLASAHQLRRAGFEVPSNTMQNINNIKKARSYIARIRNVNKRNYAENVLQNIVNKWEINEDMHPLSYMAKQAVRMNLDSILNQ